MSTTTKKRAGFSRNEFSATLEISMSTEDIQTTISAIKDILGVESVEQPFERDLLIVRTLKGSKLKLVMKAVSETVGVEKVEKHALYYPMKSGRTTSRSKKYQFININESPMPASINLTLGQDLIFVSTGGLSGGKLLHSLEVADKTLLDGLSFPQRAGYKVTGQPFGTDLRAGFRAVKTGVTELYIQFEPYNPMYKPYLAHIMNVTVATAVKKARSKKTKQNAPADSISENNSPDIRAVKKQLGAEYRDLPGFNGVGLGADGQSINVYVSNMDAFKQLPNPYHGVELNAVLTGEIEAQ